MNVVAENVRLDTWSGAVPGAFQTTDVGLLPSDWKIKVLSSLVDPDRSIRYGIVQPGRFDPHGRYMIRGQDYSAGWVDSAEFFRVSDVIEHRYRNARVRYGDILITIVGASTGRIAIVPDWLDGANLTQTTARISILPTKADAQYCAYILASWYGQVQTRGYMKGGAQPGLNCGDVERFLIPLPPTLTEQNAIAEALSDADALIECLEHLIAKKRAIKHGAMQELLSGHTRLPGFSAAWRQKALGAIAPLKRGFDLTNSEIEAGDVPVVYSNGIERFHNKAMVKGPGVLTGRSGTLGVVHFVEADFWPHNTALWVTDFNGNSPKFISYLYSFIGFQRFASGSGVPTLNRNDAHSFEAWVPSSRQEQDAIATVLADMDAESAALNAKLAKARKIKHGMMQDLLTGRVRLL